MAQQTAVEWLIEQINGYAYPMPYNQNIRVDIPKEVIKQAKEMEKEQADTAYCNGVNDARSNTVRYVYYERYERKGPTPTEYFVDLE